MEIDNLWFLKIQYVPQANVPLLKLKYDKEILRTSVQIDENTKKNLKINLSKILKQDFTKDFSNCYCLKISDSFHAKKFSFELTLTEINLSALEFKITIKQSVYYEFFEIADELITYLKRDVFDKIFANYE